MIKKLVFLVLLMPLTGAQSEICRFEEAPSTEEFISCMKGLYEQLQTQQMNIQLLEFQASQKQKQAAKIQLLEEKNQALQKTNQAQAEKIQGLEEKNQAQQAKIQGLEEKNQAQQAKIQGLEEKIQAQQNKIQSLEEKIKALRFFRYVDNGDGTVRDNKTGIIWMKNANCAGEKNWIEAKQWAANLSQGVCGLRDGSQKGDWRLPTKEEWEAMLDKRYEKPALGNAEGTGQWTEGDVFIGVKSYWYWSSTSYSSSHAWYANLYDDNVGKYGNTFKNYVWAVRVKH